MADKKRRSATIALEIFDVLEASPVGEIIVRGETVRSVAAIENELKERGLPVGGYTARMIDEGTEAEGVIIKRCCQTCGGPRPRKN